MEKILTSDNLSNATIFVSVILILVASWELIRNKKKSGVKSVSSIGWILIFFSFLSGIIAYTSRKIDANDKIKSDQLAKKKSDSTRQSDKDFFKSDVDNALKKYGLISKTTNTKNIIIVDAPKYILPILDLPVFPNIHNPTIKVSDNLDTINYAFRIACINNGIAYHLKDKYIFFRIKHGKFGYLPGFVANSWIESDKIYKDKQAELSGWLKIKDIVSKTIAAKDSLYFYIRVSYSAQPNTNKVDGIFRSFQYFTINQPIKSKTDISEMETVSNQNYQLIKKEFIAKKIW